MQKLIEMKNKKGFTLIEMLIVILIIVILLAIAVPAVAAYRRDALRTQDEGAVETIRTAIEASVIRVTPSENGTTLHANFFPDAHVGVNLDYDRIVSISSNTALDDDTREFYSLLAGYLGPNFQGNFSFAYKLDQPSGDHIDWVSYWRSDSATADESVMFYHEYYANGSDDDDVEAARRVIYFSELMEMTNDPSYHMIPYYRPRTNNVPPSAP